MMPNQIVRRGYGDESLAARLERGPLPITDAIAVADAILDALSALHRRGVIHRDLKPANIFLTDEGLKHLGEVKNLQQLFLDNTKVTDEGLKHLQKLRLVVVSVKGTKVTEAGAKSLKGVTVDR